MSDNIQQQKSTFIGEQLSKGGGDWIGSNPYDIETLMQSLPPVAQQAAEPAPRELDQPLATLRTLAQTNIADAAELRGVLADIETLQQEMEKGPAADEGLCIRMVQRINLSLPAIGATLQALSKQPPLAGRIGPNLQDVIANLAIP